MLLRLAADAMGTRFEIVLGGAADDDEPLLRACGETAIEEIERWHRLLSAFAPDSVVSRINRRAADRPVKVDHETFELLLRCRELWRATAGAFDITLGALMRAWGFRDDEPARGTVHARARVELVIHHGFSHVELDEPNRAVRFAREGIALDLGGIAKGWALDRAAALLRGHGVTCALLHGGTSSVVAIGAPPGEDGWRVALRDPAPSGPVVLLRDRALSVSAPHGRMIERDGVALGHVIDPRTGAPAATGVALAAVACASATDAEAWSTALLVLGERPANLDPSIETIVVSPGTMRGKEEFAANETTDVLISPVARPP